MLAGREGRRTSPILASTLAVSAPSATPLLTHHYVGIFAKIPSSLLLSPSDALIVQDLTPPPAPPRSDAPVHHPATAPPSPRATPRSDTKAQLSANRIPSVP